MKRIVFLVFVGLFYNPFFSFSQDSIPIAKDLTEEKELKFQQFFFKALSEKSIGNYQKAIENLETCNQILSNDISVYFEFSKNYLLLNNALLAKEYIQRALEKQVNDIWMLKHLVKVYVKEKNYSEAIKTQEKIVELNPKEKEFLVNLYMYNKDYNKAIFTINSLAEEKGLSANLKRLKINLEKQTSQAEVDDKPNNLISLINQFKSVKSYKILEEILQKSINNNDVLLQYSEEGIALFPAQPFVYLMKAKALNSKKKFKKALTILQNGIDFVIDNEMESNFYKEMASSYKGLGNFKEEKRHLEKSEKLKS